MRAPLWFGIAMVLALPVGSRTEDVGLEGCGSVTAITQALAKLEKNDLKEISLDRVQSLWPTKLEASDCTTEGCRSLLHQGRIIDGVCQCCEKIDIDQRPNSEGGVDESLVVTIYYSAPAEKDVVTAAKLLAKAAGLGDDEIRTVGREPDQSFQWKGARQTELFLMAVKFAHRDKLWTVYVHVDRHILGNTSAKSGDKRPQ
jgi:hypothetical protein